MKIKLLSILVAATAVFTSTSQAVTVTLTGLANNSIGLITLDPDGIESGPRATVSGRAIFVSTTTALTGVSASLNTLLGSASSTPAQFDTALATLIGTTTSNSPGIVRSATFSSGLLSSTGPQEVGSAGNNSYLFLVAESEGFITGIGAYTGSAVPSAGALTFNPTFANDSLGVGTSVLSPAIVGPPAQPVSGFQLVAAIPEPSAALLGAIGALGLLRRRRI